MEADEQFQTLIVDVMQFAGMLEVHCHVPHSKALDLALHTFRKYAETDWGKTTSTWGSRNATVPGGDVRLLTSKKHPRLVEGAVSPNR